MAYALGARKDFEYMELLDHRVNKMREGGLLDHLLETHLYGPGNQAMAQICSDQVFWQQRQGRKL